MNIATTSILFIATFIASWIGVGLFRRWSLHREMLDIPNERSSHSTPTPRGGGLVIVLVVLAGYVSSCLVTGTPLSLGFLAGAVIIAGVSWIDDLFSLPFWLRLLVHISAAGFLIADSGFVSRIALPFSATDITFGPIVGIVLTGAWVVWLINAYNFMDGIDGIAALQATIAGGSWAVLGWMHDLPVVSAVGGILACAAAGFLVHNWQPAKIFMGDVGSAFLGFTLAAMPLFASTKSPDAPSWLILAAIVFVWYFVFDAMFTFFRRLIKGQRVWRAHREHIYQKLVIGGRSHASVTLLYGVLALAGCVLTILSLSLSGIFSILAVLSFVLPTLALIYLGFRNNR